MKQGAEIAGPDDLTIGDIIIYNELDGYKDNDVMVVVDMTHFEEATIFYCICLNENPNYFNIENASNIRSLHSKYLKYWRKI